MPTESVASRAKVVVRRWLRMRSSKAGRSVQFGVSIVSLDLIVCVAMRRIDCAASKS